MAARSSSSMRRKDANLLLADKRIADLFKFYTRQESRKSFGALSLSDAIQHVYGDEDAALASLTCDCDGIREKLGDDIVMESVLARPSEEISALHHELRRTAWGKIMVSDMFSNVLMSAEQAGIIFFDPKVENKMLSAGDLANPVRLAHTLALNMHHCVMDMSRIFNCIVGHYSLGRLGFKGSQSALRALTTDILDKASKGRYRVFDKKIQKMLFSAKGKDIDPEFPFDRYLNHQLHEYVHSDDSSAEWPKQVKEDKEGVYLDMVEHMLDSINLPQRSIGMFMNKYRKPGSNKLYLSNAALPLIKQLVVLSLQPFFLALLSRFIQNRYLNGVPDISDLKEAAAQGLPEAARVDKIEKIHVSDTHTLIIENSLQEVGPDRRFLDSLHDAMLNFGQVPSHPANVKEAMKKSWVPFFRVKDMTPKAKKFFVQYVSFIVDLQVKRAMCLSEYWMHDELRQSDLLASFVESRFSNLIEVYRDKFDMSMRTSDLGSYKLLEAAHYMVREFIIQKNKIPDNADDLVDYLKTVNNRFVSMRDITKSFDDIEDKEQFSLDNMVEPVLQLLMRQRNVVRDHEYMQLASEIMSFRRPLPMQQLDGHKSGKRLLYMYIRKLLLTAMRLNVEDDGIRVMKTGRSPYLMFMQGMQDIKKEVKVEQQDGEDGEDPQGTSIPQPDEDDADDADDADE